MKQSPGFILLMVLGIIMGLSLLVLGSLQSLLEYQQVINKQELGQQDFYQLEYAARKLAKDLPQSNCLLVQDKANEVLTALVQKKGCSLNIKQVSYRYIIEDLGYFPCLLVSSQKATRHFRISLMVLGKTATALLQIRWIQASEGASCTKKTYFIKEGISSWRYLRM